MITPFAGQPRLDAAHFTAIGRNVAVFGAILLCLVGSGVAPAQEAPSDAPGVPVEAEQVRVQRVVDTIHAVGTLRAEQSIIVRPEINGVVTDIRFEEGERVEKGALLFGLEDSIYRAELAQAEASLRLSTRNYTRARELFERKVGTGLARDEALSRLEVDRAAVEVAKARLAKTRIHAPFEGVTGLRQVDLGAYVETGQDLVTLDDVDPLKVDFELPERYLRFVSPGQIVEVQLDALPGRTFSGEIVAISPRVSPAGRSLSVRARTPNPNGELRPGLFARVSVVVDQRQSAIVVPEQAIVPRGSDLYVFKVVDGTARLAKVAVGLRAYGQAEIVEGLEEGDLVVTAGQMKIRDGVPVTILETGGAGG